MSENSDEEVSRGQSVPFQTHSTDAHRQIYDMTGLVFTPQDIQEGPHQSPAN